MIFKVLIGVAWFSYLPFAILFILGLMRIRKMKGERVKDPNFKVPYFIFQITTIGKSPRSTQEAIYSIHRNVYGYPYDVWVVTEPQDKNEYKGAEKIVVPASYSTANKVKYKARALQYATELRKKRNLISNENWVVFLDDDNLLTQEYFNEILKVIPDSVAGQGILVTSNKYGIHTFSSLADNVRPSACIAFCSFFNSRGNPFFIHGEGLVVRSDIEYEVGWDLDVLIEDFFFGRRVARKYPGKFNWINAYVELKSPLSSAGFMKQRRRWMWGFIRGFSLLGRKEKLSIICVFYMFFSGFISLIGVVSSFLGFLHYPLYLTAIFTAVSTCFFGSYQVGCFFNTKKLKIWRRIGYHLLQLILQWVVCAYEAGLIWMGLLRAPKKYEVIRKDQ